MFRALFLFSAAFCMAEALLIKPKPIVPTKCNIYEIDLQWVLQDCICRPIQNPCLLAELNKTRIENCKTPLVSVSKEECKYFIPKICLWGPPVIASFPKPPICGCPHKPGTIDERTFDNVCLLLKYSAEKDEAYTSYKSLPLLELGKGKCKEYEN